MAQHALPSVAPHSSDSLAYLDQPSDTHAFLFGIYGGVIATWLFAMYLALSFHAY